MGMILKPLNRSDADGTFPYPYHGNVSPQYGRPEGGSYTESEVWCIMPFKVIQIPAGDFMEHDGRRQIDGSIPSTLLPFMESTSEMAAFDASIL
jgi:hypothetical protein